MVVQLSYTESSLKEQLSTIIPLASSAYVTLSAALWPGGHDSRKQTVAHLSLSEKFFFA
jgi:hypothetical protein